LIVKAKLGRRGERRFAIADNDTGRSHEGPIGSLAGRPHVVDLGVLTVDNAVPDSAEAEKKLPFLPRRTDRWDRGMPTIPHSWVLSPIKTTL
jgi:hypothetical protein